MNNALIHDTVVKVDNLQEENKNLLRFKDHI